MVTPGKSPILDFGFRLLTGKSAKADFEDRRENIIPTLKKHFEVKQNLTFPKFNASPVKLYTAMELVPKKPAPTPTLKRPAQPTALANSERSPVGVGELVFRQSHP